VNRDAERHLDAAWREAIRIVFQQRVLATASEFPESLTNKEKRNRDNAVDFIARATGTEREYVSNALTEAAHNYLSAKPSEADSAWLQPPNWPSFVTGWEVPNEVVISLGDVGGLSQ
jgi:hypothetical protein